MLVTVAAVALVAATLAAIGRTTVSLASTALSTLVATELPEPLEDAVEADLSLPTIVTGADGTEIGRFRPETLQRPVRWDEIPESVRVAIVAAEDSDFWTHVGVDVRAAARAFVANARRGEIVQGGSTITQQLAKNLYTSGDRSIDRKLDEFRLALELERQYTKQEIFTAYVNTVYLGENAIGIGAAARTYFRKAVSDLTLSEAALLAGVIPAPSIYSPRVDPELAEQRRLLVLDRVEATGGLPPEEVAAARHAPPEVKPARHSSARYPYAVDYVRRWLLDVAGVAPRDLFGGGLRIETTIDPRIQDAARDVVKRHLPEPHNPSAAVVVLDPATGHVRALVGGRDWDTSSVNLALGARGGGTGRQPGSSFKPFVLATAFEHGVSPLDRIEAPETYTPRGTDAVVHNYTRRGYAPMTLAEATKRSINTSFVSLTDFVGPNAVAEMARATGLGVPEDVGPSIGIGTYEVSPLGMAAAYGSFAVDGRRVDPSPVAAVKTASGETLDLGVHVGPGDEAMSSDTARLVTSTLRGVAQPGGTGRAADIGRPLAGKTGTTNDYTNAWFVGYTPQLVAAVWVGFEEGAIPMRDINGVARVTGGSFPARIWHDVMQVAHDGLPVADFAPAPHRPPATTTTIAPTTTLRPE
ncbi:MAG TPA: transglycosylase domain-containing protein, partial [Acidimicrobiales bacterium]|nr:transglycosylase domain-containing protein [Acidimicrobiales bacterium]